MYENRVLTFKACEITTKPCKGFSLIFNVLFTVHRDISVQQETP